MFTCDCGATRYEGANCEVERSAATSSDSDVTVVLTVLLSSLLLAGVAGGACQKRAAHKKANAPVSFETQLRDLKDKGLIIAQGADRLPRELRRAWLTMVAKLGNGNFGEVWKGMLDDKSAIGHPEYMVAAKIVLDAEGGDEAAFAAAETDLLKEALLMAQVDTHKNLVSIVGVITRGQPKVLVLSYCEHGELQKELKKRASAGMPFGASAKLQFCAEIADGMGHLAQHNFVHRDLAARNVLLSSGMVCKVADFGLSRRVQTDDNAEDCEFAAPCLCRRTVGGATAHSML